MHDDIVMSIWLARMALLSEADDFVVTFAGPEDIHQH
jgi:hypothetical protein